MGASGDTPPAEFEGAIGDGAAEAGAKTLTGVAVATAVGVVAVEVTIELTAGVFVPAAIYSSSSSSGCFGSSVVSSGVWVFVLAMAYYPTALAYDPAGVAFAVAFVEPALAGVAFAIAFVKPAIALLMFVSCCIAVVIKF